MIVDKRMPPSHRCFASPPFATFVLTMIQAQGKHKAAMHHYQTLVDFSDTHLPAWSRLAHLRSTMGDDVAAALRAWLRVLELDPGHPGAHYAVARLLQLRGDSGRKVEEHYLAALKLDETDYRGHMELAALYRDVLQQLPAARHHLSAALCLRPESTEVCGWN